MIEYGVEPLPSEKRWLLVESPLFDNYPKLLAWYRSHDLVVSEHHSAADQLIFNLCETLAHNSAVGLRRFIDRMTLFLESADRPLSDFLKADEICQECNTEILEIFGLIGELAVRRDCGAEFFQVMQKSAQRTGLAVFRFLAAWTALNIGKIELCIIECEKVDKPFASIFTIQGQALLELGRVEEAADVLEIAVKLAPAEPLGWFQLAKAEHVAGNLDRAFEALRHCRQIIPNSAEVNVYMGIIALDVVDCAHSKLIDEATQALKTMWPIFADNSLVTFTLLKLACRGREKALARNILETAKWQMINGDNEAVKLLPSVLRLLHEADWLDLAKIVLEKLLDQPSSSINA